MIFVQIIPAHLIHADGENRFHVRINTLRKEFGQYQLVHKKSRGMAQVKDQRVSQWYRFFEVTLVVGQAIEESCVSIECIGEILRNLIPFIFDITPVESGCSEKSWLF